MGDEPEPTDALWLDAWDHPVADIRAFSGCMALSDVEGDGDHRLLVANSNKRLKIYRGMILESEHVILDTPSALCSYYMDSSAREIPAVAVASGSCIFIYRNLRPYFKFTLPPLDVHPQEAEIWTQLTAEATDVPQAVSEISELRDSMGVMLTPRSLDLLAMENPEAQEEYVKLACTFPLKHTTVITCMGVLNKSMEEEGSTGCLVLGLEVKQLMILSPDAHTIICKLKLPSAPAFIAAGGTFDVEYRIFVGCREGTVCIVKNGELLSQTIELDTPPCGLVRLKSLVICATMSNALHAYSHKGKKKWSVYLPCNTLVLEPLFMARNPHPNCYLVALENGEVRLYNERNLVTTIHCGDRKVSAMRFGSYGREEGALAIAYKSGGITLKMLPRLADLGASGEPPGPPPEQDIPLQVPKKTKLYVEQTQRERDHSTEMHRIFQRDLCKLRLDTARSYVKIITDGQSPLTYTSGSALRLNAQVQGLGALFSIRITLQNTGTKPIYSVRLVFAYNHMLYKVDQPCISVPVLVPGFQYRYAVNTTCIDEDGGAEPVQVFVCGGQSVVPMISAIVNMPLSDIVMDES